MPEVITNTIPDYSAFGHAVKLWLNLNKVEDLQWTIPEKVSNVQVDEASIEGKTTPHKQVKVSLMTHLNQSLLGSGPYLRNSSKDYINVSLPLTPKASLVAQINPFKYIRNKLFHVTDADWNDLSPLSPFIPWKQAHFSVIDPYFKPNSVHYGQTNSTNWLSWPLMCTWFWNESSLSIEVEVVNFYINNFFLLGIRRHHTSFLLGREGSTCKKHVHIYSIQAHCI